MSIETYQFLDEQSVKLFASKLINKSNIRIEERIVKEINENSTDKQVASARALYKLLSTVNANATELSDRLDEHDVQLTNHASALTSANSYQTTQDGKLTNIESGIGTLASHIGDLNHLTVQNITGDISTITDPRTDVLYFQRDNEADTMWMLYIYKNGSWVNIGDTEVDLSVIWSKDEVEELKEALGMHDVADITDAELSAEIEAAFGDTVVNFNHTTE